MRIEVYEEKPKAKPEKVLRLRLVEIWWHAGVVALQAVDENGVQLPCGSLLFFYADGTVRRARTVNPNLGLPLDDAGRLVIE